MSVSLRMDTFSLFATNFYFPLSILSSQEMLFIWHF